MIDKNEIVERRRVIAEIRHADSVYRDIQARLKEREQYEKRWFWELLQNAKDAVEPHETVDVSLEIKEKEVVFSHTGNPFELDDILSLIIQGSSKVEQEGKTGRFGTGFMTTYLLSRKVRISGKLTKEQGYFDFTLNRAADSNSDFYDRQSASNSDFEDSIRDQSYLGGTPFQTKFAYQLEGEEDSTGTINAGQESLDDLIPFTQLFNNQIQSVFVYKEGREYTYTKTEVEEYHLGGQKVKKWQLDTRINGEVQKRLMAYLYKGQEYDACLVTIREGEVERILPLSKRIPRLYFTFPLIGTEEFGIPLIINSTKFDPRIERDGIYLRKSSDKKGEEVNKGIIQTALGEVSGIFAQIVADKEIESVYEFFNYRVSSPYPWVDNEWLNTVKEEVFREIAAKPLIATSNKGKVSLNRIKVPFLKEEQLFELLWSLLAPIKEVTVPLLEEARKWSTVLEQFASITGREVHSLEQLFGIRELINFVEEKQDLLELKRVLSCSDKWWLNAFIKLINTHYENFPLERSILLNQNEIFRSGDGMCWDDSKDEELTAISALCRLDFANRFISSLIVPFEVAGIDGYTKTDAVTEIKNHFNGLRDASYESPDVQQANARFLKWLIANRQLDTIRDLKIIAGQKNEEEEIMAGPFPKGKHLLLPPKVYFEGDYPLYANIIREKDCLNSIYNQFLTGEDYRYLEACGCIHQAPLLIKKEKVDVKTLELLACKEEDLNYLKDEEGKIKEPLELEYSDFAYLTTSEGHIYDRNSTPKSSLERFRFMLLEAAQKDPFLDDDLQEVKVEGQERSLYFHKALWLYRARRLNWVYVKNENVESDKKLVNVMPSSKNLSELIKNDEALIQAIRGDRQQTFLNKLGIGVSDLIRNTLPSDALRESWDKAITNMITSKADPELVQEIFSDEKVRAEYENRLNQRRLINRNQRIGALVEQLFTEVINYLKAQGHLISIERKPFGSDYLITDESSDWVGATNEREGLEVNNWLVEVKATGKSFAAMTEKQAKTAGTKKEYALVVVPLDETEPDLEYVRVNARVVSNIGEKINSIIGDFDEVEAKKVSLLQGKEGVSVNIEDHNVRFRVDSTVWNASHVESIEGFVKEKFTKVDGYGVEPKNLQGML